ncbi:multicopper oxidase domain-containing protein [Oceanicoccus sagamiensis]|nr:multicopper oxidase domain-containing protein [Oceanicoccus sagamiensis]
MSANVHAAVVRLSESHISVLNGDTFTLQLIGQGFDSATLDGGGVTLSYDPTLIHVQSVAINTIDWEFFSTTGSIDNDVGRVSGMSFNSFQNRTGDLLFATIELAAVGGGDSLLVLSDDLLNPFASGGSLYSDVNFANTVVLSVTEVPVPSAGFLLLSALSAMSALTAARRRRLVAGLSMFAVSSTALAWTGSVSQAVDVNPDPDIFETTLVVEQTVMPVKGTGTTPATLYTFNGMFPGPEIKVKTGDRVIIHMINNLPVGEGMSIHSHGVELSNNMDGTQITQDPVPPGSRFTYDYIVPRPGSFWYHPHIRTSNKTFKGLYGPLTVSDPNEDILREQGILPGDAYTHTLVLSDITLCEDVTDSDLNSIKVGCVGQSAGHVPNIQPEFDCVSTFPNCVVFEGKTVLSNGRAVEAGDVLDVPANQPVRFRVINSSLNRYFRLVQPVSGPLIRIGGEGGLLNNAVLDPVALPAPDNGKLSGDILLAPSERADFIFIPQTSDVGSVITILSDLPSPANVNRGFSLNGNLTSAPVLQINVGAAITPDSKIHAGDPLLAHSSVNKPLEDLSKIPATALGSLLDPALFGRDGSANSTIALTASGGIEPGIDGVRGRFMNMSGYQHVPNIATTRYAVLGDVLELQVTNSTPVDHPFHMHGNSFQLMSRSDGRDFPVEFIDTVNIPSNHSVVLRVRLEDKLQIVDNVLKPYGGLGRWLFHCHITTHAELGMISELVVVAPPEALCADVEVLTDGFGSPLMASIDGGTFDPDSDAISISQSPAGPYFPGITDVTLTATDEMGLSNSCVGTVSNFIDEDGDGIANPLDNCQIHANGSLVPDAGGNIQRDSDGDGYGNRCDGDLNNDGMVNVLDLGLFKHVFFSADPHADINGDGIVNVLDLGLFKELFFKVPGPSGFFD